MLLLLSMAHWLPPSLVYKRFQPRGPHLPHLFLRSHGKWFTLPNDSTARCVVEFHLLGVQAFKQEWYLKKTYKIPGRLRLLECSEMHFCWVQCRLCDHSDTCWYCSVWRHDSGTSATQAHWWGLDAACPSKYVAVVVSSKTYPITLVFKTVLVLHFPYCVCGFDHHAFV